MGIRESLLNTITSVADSDFVRIVTSAGTSSKATVKNLFKGFESNLGAKSSLTVSDYFRVVGSDNEAYKQSVSAVKTALGIDALNSMIGTVTTLTDGDDLNTLVRTGMYYHKTSRPSNIPVAVDYGFLVVLGAQVGSQVTTLQLYSSTGGRLYYRRKAGNVSDNWAAWKYVTATNA